MPALTEERHDLVTALCARFAEVTGWPLHFTPVDPISAQATEHRLRRSEEVCWIGEVDDGEQRTGFLHITLPENPRRDQLFVPVTELAVSLAELLSEVCAAGRRLETRGDEISTLARVGMATHANNSLAASLSSLLEAATQLSGYRSAAFFLLSPATNELRLKSSFRVDAKSLPPTSHPLHLSRPDLMALSHGPVIVQRGNGPDERWLPPDVMSSLCVAVQSERVPIGTLWLYDRRRRDVIERDIQVLQSVAAQLAAVLERVVLLKESEEQQRMSTELRAASENQQIPGDQILEFPGFDLGARYVSKCELGGDLCEIIPIDEETTLIAIGDASGHSIPAAMVMAYARGAVRALPLGLKGWEVGAASLMSRINRSLYSITSPHQFMSLFLGVFHSKTNQLVYCNAGHPNPLLSSGDEIIPLQSHGLLVGVIDESEYDEATLNIAPGDTLVLFTDGISEAMSNSEQLFRAEGIISAVRASQGPTAEDVLYSVWNRMLSHSSDEEGQDDRTLMVLKFK
ncbi:MAG: SpoIIE family protein phosphatase [Planctomycetaceae bacterium]|nr:SpoIIE family protein phosphatase [Planctomycetaceae bacterium]